MEDKNLKTCERQQVQSNSKWSLCPAHTLPRSAYKTYICFQLSKTFVKFQRKKPCAINFLFLNRRQTMGKNKVKVLCSLFNHIMMTWISDLSRVRKPQGSGRIRDAKFNKFGVGNDLSFGRQGAICLSSGARPSHRSTSMDVLCMNGSTTWSQKSKGRSSLDRFRLSCCQFFSPRYTPPIGGR